MSNAASLGPDAGSTTTALSAVLRAALDPGCLAAFGAGKSHWFAYYDRVCDHAVAGFPAAVDLAFAPAMIDRLSGPEDAEWFAMVRPRLATCLAATPSAASGALMVGTNAPPVRTVAAAGHTPIISEAVDHGAPPPTDLHTLALAESTDPAAQTVGSWDVTGIHPDQMTLDAKELASMPTPPSVSPKQITHLQRMRKTRMARHEKGKDVDPTSFVVEAHGHSVQIVRKPNGVYHRRHTVFVREVKTGVLNKEVRQRSLGTSEAAVAVQTAKEFLRRVACEKRGVAPGQAVLPAAAVSAAELGGQTTVADAIEKYIASAALRKLSPKTQSSYRSALAALAASFGPTTVLERVGEEDLKRHSETRIQPRFRYRPVDRNGFWGRTEIVKEKAVNEQTVNSDLTTFAILWNWCARTIDKQGGRLVGVPMPVVPRFGNTDDAHRPTANSGRSEALMASLDAQTDDLGSRITDAHDLSAHQRKDLSLALRRALYARLGLVLAGLFGVRRSSVATLRWDHVDLEGTKSDDGPRITFLTKNSAGGRPIKHTALIPPEVFPMLELLLNTLGSRDASEYVFPQVTTPSRHVSPDELGTWLDQATAEAGLPKLEGGVWHPFRRGWVQSLLAAGWDAQQVAKYGGWKDLATFHRSYALRLPETEKAIIGSTTMAKLLGRRSETAPGEMDANDSPNPAERAMTRPTKRTATAQPA